MAGRKSLDVSKNPLLPSIKCMAIDPSGCLGIFYDVHRDRVVKPSNLNSDEKVCNSPDTVKCVVKNPNKDKNSNLLQLIDMSEHLRLSALVDPELRTGIASITDHLSPIDKYTRILHYSRVQRDEKLPDEAEKAQKCFKSLSSKVNATHIITGISYGIDVAVVLQLPPDAETALKIDHVLEIICSSLQDDNTGFTLNEDEQNLLQQIIDTMVYSNISDLTTITTFSDVHLYIDQYKIKATDIPIMYTLLPIKWIYPSHKDPGAQFVNFTSKDNGKIEQHLIQLSNTIKSLKNSFDFDVTRLLNGQLDRLLSDMQREWLELNKKHEAVIKQFKQFIIDYRYQRADIYGFEQLMNTKDYIVMNELIKKLTEYVKHIEPKGKFITELQEQNFEYCNVADRNVSKNDNNQRLAHKLITDSQNDRVLCCNDDLKNKNRAKLNKLINQLTTEHDDTPDLRLIYADFSYCLYPLQELMILPSIKQEINKKVNKPKSSTPSNKPKFSTAQSKDKKIRTPPPTADEMSTPLSPPPLLVTDDVINILLLGETGVGKSTFINAFVNYLTFKTFDQAESNTPVVLIPVSFLMTVGDSFEERMINFGDFDSSKNEDFEHTGESVTQHCKSYLFHIGDDNKRKKLCIIDTPGFGDTRGLDQDDFNMQDILDYINNLTHLNAVCFLLKPNASELHTFFRMCFTQLLDLLGPNVRENIIFCFTNARSTFYTPGDTAPLLKNMLKSLSLTDIPFKKDNTFCFDNESFRYLVALQGGVQFNDERKHEYERSWSYSVTESDRLISFICTQLGICPMHSDWKSNKHAEIEIVRMIRPLLEAMRNMLRNIILSKFESSTKSIELYPRAIHRQASVCLLCTPYPIRVGNFWIVRDIPHEFLKKCLVCSCATDQHVQISYVIHYKDVNIPTSKQQKENIEKVYGLCRASAEFDYFLQRGAHSSKSDPFLVGLIRMITEEDYLCKNQKPNRLNLELYKALYELRFKYEERMEQLKSNQQQTTLPSIYKSITTIREYSLIKEQLEVIKQTQKMTTEPYEVSQD